VTFPNAVIVDLLIVDPTACISELTTLTFKQFVNKTNEYKEKDLKRMPVDQKRINGPDTSTSYEIYIYSETKDNEIQRNVPKRHDDRSNNELRNICKSVEVVFTCYISTIKLILISE